MHSKVSLALVVAAELGEVLDGPVAALDVELAKHRDHDGVCFEAARAFALASKAVIPAIRPAHVVLRTARSNC